MVLRFDRPLVEGLQDAKFTSLLQSSLLRLNFPWCIEFAARHTDDVAIYNMRDKEESITDTLKKDSNAIKENIRNTMTVSLILVSE